MTEVVLVEDLARKKRSVVTFHELKNVYLSLILDVVVLVLHGYYIVERELLLFRKGLLLIGNIIF